MFAAFVEGATVVFDTDIIVWALRDNEKALFLLEETGERFLSVISYMELLIGAKDKKESRLIRKFLADAMIQILPLSENIGHRASIYVEEYGLKTAFDIADALVAATAVENGLTLCTGNVKHFKQITDLEINVFRP